MTCIHAGILHISREVGRVVPEERELKLSPSHADHCCLCPRASSTINAARPFSASYRDMQCNQISLVQTSFRTARCVASRRHARPVRSTPSLRRPDLITACGIGPGPSRQTQLTSLSSSPCSRQRAAGQVCSAGFRHVWGSCDAGGCRGPAAPIGRRACEHLLVTLLSCAVSPHSL